jgi:CRP-like cAMP-binding protein
VTAATDLVCYGLTFWEFRPLVERNGALAWKLLQALAKRLRAADPSIANHGGKPGRESPSDRHARGEETPRPLDVT